MTCLLVGGGLADELALVARIGVDEARHPVRDGWPRRDKMNVHAGSLHHTRIESLK